MRVRALLPRLSIVAAAVLVVCALQALSGVAAGLDGGFVSGEPDAALAPATAPDNTMATRSERRRQRRLKRLGQPENVDAGAARDATAVRDAGPVRIAVRDAGARLPVMAPPPVAPPAPPPAPSPPSTTLPVTDLGFNTCRKIPAGKRAVKVNLKPEIELPELVAWISSITCKSFVLPGHLSGGKKITIVTQGVMTPREAYATFLSALDSVGLTVEQAPGFLKIIETSKAKTSSLPVYGFDGEPTEQKSRRKNQSQTDAGK